MNPESPSPTTLPAKAQVVVIGGGVIGCSVLYHLAERGIDAVLIEKNDLTNGATWHAVGLVGQIRSSRNATRLIRYSAELYRNIEKITGQSAGWTEVGSLRIASSEDRMMELRKIATQGKSFGLEVELLTPEQCKEKFPPMSTEKCVGGLWCPTDGYADPSMLTQALARGARQNGGKIFRDTLVEGFENDGKSITKVITDKGTIECDTIVNAAGMWARRIGKMAGVNVPLAVIEHQYVVTKEIEGVARDLPVTRDPDKLIYYRPEVGGLIMGGFEHDGILNNHGDVPWDFVSQLYEPNLEQFEKLFLPAMEFTPCLETAEVRQMVNGPDGYTPDSNYLLGPTEEFPNFFLATGMNCFGIAGAGGVGKCITEWIVDGKPRNYLYSEDIRRFGAPHHRGDHFVGERTTEHYSRHYTMAWPHKQDVRERNTRRSALYDKLLSQGAVMGEKAGWERPLWFAPDGVEPVEQMKWGRPHWHDQVGREVKAIRENVAILDQSSFGKIEIRGADSLQVLQRLCTRNMDKPIGDLSYTQMCNKNGGIECDITIARLADDHFYMITGTSFVAHDLAWVKGNIQPGESCVAYDATSSRGVLNLCGPNSRKVLEKTLLTKFDDVSHEGFPFGTCKHIHIGSAPALALRVSYHGELGWELHIAPEYMAYTYETLMEAGKEFNIANVGYRALESCRLEKCYLYWSGDLTPDYDPYSGGLGFNVHLKKKADFIGKDALKRIKDAGAPFKLFLFELEEDAELYGNEPLFCDGEVVEVVTSGGYGHTVGKTLAIAYLPSDKLDTKTYEIESFGKRIKAIRHDQCVYDPNRERILC
jgi:sarcosine dehydrogenase